MIKFETYYAEYYPKVLRFFMHKINNREEAEDLTQETFAYSYKNFDNYDPEKSKFSTWIYLISNSRLKNYYRDRRSFADYADLEGVLSTDPISEIDQAMYLESVRNEVAAALCKLSEKNREIIVKKYFLQKSHSEIASEMGITEVNSRVLLARAMKKLGEILHDKIHQEV